MSGSAPTATSRLACLSQKPDTDRSPWGRSSLTPFESGNWLAQRETGRLDGDGKPIKELCFVFPTGSGNIEDHGNIINRGLNPPDWQPA